LRARAGVLPEEVGRKNFEFYGTKLTGATQQRDRWKRALGLAESLVGHEIGKIFVDRHFPASSKAEMDELVEYLVRAYRERISQLEWMTPETRERALEKLGNLRPRLATQIPGAITLAWNSPPQVQTWLKTCATAMPGRMILSSTRLASRLTVMSGLAPRRR
jgi:Predicted metalloendopeptidase